MKCFGNKLTVLAAAYAAISLMGCGGGGGDGGGESAPPPAQTTAPATTSPPPAPAQNTTPANVAPPELTAKTIRLASENTTRELRFTASGYDELSNGTEIASGTYQYSRPATGNSATLVLQENSGAVTVTLTFGNAAGGSFSYTQGRTGSGTFTLQTTQISTTGGQTGETSGSTSGSQTTGSSSGSTGNATGGNTSGSTGTTTSGTSGLAPVSIAGKTMLGTRTFTSTGPVGQTHTYTFASNSFHDSDPPEEADGTYAYTPNGNSAVMILDYTAPAHFVGDRHEIQMTFTANNSGNFNSTYRRGDGTVIAINGTFEFP